MNTQKKHGEYITELSMLKSLYKQVVADQVAVSGERDFKGADFSLGFSFLTEPFLMIDDSHTHDFDQVIFFLGGDPANIGEFGAEVEMYLDGKQHIIDYTSCVHVPAGLSHGPLDIKKVEKPIMFIDVTLSPGHSIRPVPPQTPRRD
jgi:hypothetical protein